MAILVLFSCGEFIDTYDDLENLWIEVDVAAVARGQDVPFFEVGEGVFNKDPAFCRMGKNSAASEFGISDLLRCG